jgi:hypothetical protein
MHQSRLVFWIVKDSTEETGVREQDKHARSTTVVTLNKITVMPPTATVHNTYPRIVLFVPSHRPLAHRVSLYVRCFCSHVMSSHEETRPVRQLLPVHCDDQDAFCAVLIYEVWAPRHQFFQSVVLHTFCSLRTKQEENLVLLTNP